MAARAKAKRQRAVSASGTHADAVAAAGRPERVAGVILCGGSGTRMGRTRSHKVCASVAGRPAIVRLIGTLRRAGVDPLVVVVGHRAGDVVETVGAAHPGVTFVYQRDRLGTGHAARIGMDALAKFGCDGLVLITMGDKWFEPALVRSALQRFHDARADLLLVTTPKTPKSSAGRLVAHPRNGILGIVELRDIQRGKVLEDWLAMASRKAVLSRGALRAAGLERIRPAKKLWRALGPLATFSHGTGTVRASELAQAIRETGFTIQVGKATLEPDQIEQYSPTVNESVYIGRAVMLRETVCRIGRDNAQDEYYLTDLVELTAAGGKGRVVEHRLACADDVMAFNTRGELQRIEARVRRVERAATDFTSADKRLAPYTRTPAQWLRILNPASLAGRRLVERTYGVGGPLIAERIRDLRKVVRLFARTHGRDRRCFLVRAPGRVNLMGRHVDHQGGHVHAMALDREVVMAVAPRKDGVIRLVNTEPVTFPFRELLLGDWRPTVAAVEDWLTFVDGEAVRAHLASTAGDWSNYVLAAAIYQQHRLPNRRLRGMDVALHGNVPMAAGLSSSSSMVVASMEAVAAVNGIRAAATELVNWCGEAEWFVGSRGGSSDQAAIRLGRAGFAARMEFHPFRVSQYVPIPENAAVLIAYSGEHAVKSAGARDRFNERVANYRLGLLLLKKRHPRLARRLEYVRDLLPTALGADAGRTFALLGDLPERIARRQIQRELGARYADLVERIFSSHEDPGEYTIREVVAFGVGECERSRIAAAQLEQGDLEAFGELMQLSHDGDRVSGKPAGPLVAASGGIHSNGMPLHHLVGKYACSTKNIDRLVDIARAVPGVYGAQLAGAGLGGCVMVLAQRDAATRVRKALTDAYYRPREMTPAVWQVRSVAGGGLIRP